MGDALKLGPLLLPLELLVVLAAVGCMLLVGKRIGTKASGDVESALWYALFVGLVGARIAFVFEYRSLCLTACHPRYPRWRMERGGWAGDGLALRPLPLAFEPGACEADALVAGRRHDRLRRGNGVPDIPAA
jgi:hypothetical protein